MKINDYVFRFSTNGANRNDAIFRVRQFVSSNLKIYLILTELSEKNPSQSITNAIENVRLQLIEKGLITEEAVVLEHYDRDYPRGGTFDFVSFDKQNKPTWEKTELSKVCDLLECEYEEFLIQSLNIRKIYLEVEQIRHEIDPFLDEPRAEPYEVINRRNTIQKMALPEGALLRLIKKNALETELQSLIKSDLSILGDFYSHPSEEYICFSEFPLDDGFVDFVIFSGRSKMDITLIEIKGANYKLINGNSYKDFSAKTNQAVQQIRRRIGYITRNYEEFRKSSHKTRQQAENGKCKFNALVGPIGCLQVDPDKDINLHTVVIGGLSIDDIDESRLRYEYERGNSPSIRIESWNSWINKSIRK